MVDPGSKTAVSLSKPECSEIFEDGFKDKMDEFLNTKKTTESIDIEIQILNKPTTDLSPILNSELPALQSSEESSTPYSEAARTRKVLYLRDHQQSPRDRLRKLCGRAPPYYFSPSIRSTLEATLGSCGAKEHSFLFPAPIRGRIEANCFLRGKDTDRYSIKNVCSTKKSLPEVEEEVLLESKMDRYLDQVQQNVTKLREEIERERNIFKNDVRACLMQESDKYAQKLRIRRNEIRQQMYRVRQKQQMLQKVYATLSNEFDEAHTEYQKCEDFLRNIPTDWDFPKLSNAVNKLFNLLKSSKM